MRGEQETDLFRQMILRQLNTDRNRAKGSWLNLKRYQIWGKLIEESFEVLTAYLWLCFAEVRHERFNTYQTLVDLIEARQRLGEEISDCAACLLFLADSTAALYGRKEKAPANRGDYRYSAF